MNKLVAILVVLGTLAAAPLANAEATRTWVSGVGDDVNPCSRTAPCKTWAGAISKTAVGGEIDALDPGGFGALTITKSLTIDGGGGIVASTLSSGTNGIIINISDPTGTVILKNITINGAGTTLGTNGILIQSARAVHLLNVHVFNYSTTGLDDATTVQGAGGLVTIRNSSFTNCTIGIKNEGSGKIVINNSEINDNSDTGIVATGTGSPVVSLFGSTVSGAGSGYETAPNPPTSTGVEADGNGLIFIAHSFINNAGVGITANGASVRIKVADTWITNNNQGLSHPAGSITSALNNVMDNGTEGTFTGTFAFV